MNYLNLLDSNSALVVLGGIVIATTLRCGLRSTCIALCNLASVLRPGFNATKARARLAQQIQEVHRNGLLRTEPRHFGDREFDEVADALIEYRSLSALLDKHQAHKESRIRRNLLTVSTLTQAAEMGPVMGLAGTLIALNQLPASGDAGAMLSTSIPGAILTTFYGLVAANFLFFPIARFIERRADREECERQKLIDWLTSELAREGVRDRNPQERVAA